MGSTPVGGSENSFSEYFDLRMLLHYLHFIQVTNPFIKNCHVFSSCDRGDCTFMNGLFDYWGIGHITGITSRVNIHVTQFMNVILRGTLHLVWLLYIGIQINTLEYFNDKNMYGCCSFQPFWLACHAPDKLKWGNYSNQCHWENSAHIDKRKLLCWQWFSKQSKQAAHNCNKYVTISIFLTLKCYWLIK